MTPALAQSSRIAGDACYHCGLPLPADLDLRLTIDGAERAMCCHGCLAVAQAIVAAGHENFYRVRSEAAPTGQALVPAFIRESEIYDSAEIQRQYVHRDDNDLLEVSLILEGITCAACIWLIEQTLAGLPGVEQVRVNYATQRALLRWDGARIRLSEILQAIRKVGYGALPYNPRQQQESQRRERRRQQRRLAVAGLFGMQVMMLSISLYAGAWSGMERSFADLFRWLSLGLTLPVVAYAALPFFRAALRELGQGRVSMDLPVSLAILVAFLSSGVSTLKGSGEVYFDSVVMFVFFLSASRYFEAMARQRCAMTVEQLVQSLPLTATPVNEQGEAAAAVPAAMLQVGDRVLIRPGDTVPADGVVVDGASELDESLLSGESSPRVRGLGERLLGGSVNVTRSLQMEVRAVGADTVIAEIQRSIERAQADKPPMARLADRVAARFISLVLLIVAGVSVYWWLHDASRWFEIALSVLIVSCPCALSLATPTAISAILGRMQVLGLLVRRAGALEKLLQVTHVVFDKTGTLTKGQPALREVICAAGVERSEVLMLAALLEQHSAHPLAEALRREAGDLGGHEIAEVNEEVGKGLRGKIDGRDYWLGSIDFIRGHCGAGAENDRLEADVADGLTAIALASDRRILARFTFSDELRDDALGAIRRLRESGKSVLLMSGDTESAVRQVAAQTGIEDWRAQMAPQQKMDAVQALQAESGVVLMVGDGINDAPVLAAADVSIAMAGASSLAKINADIVLLRDHLGSVVSLFAMAQRTRRVIQQNMGWALLYNFGAIPAAAIGLVAPWLAALGMSLSSLLVVVNAMRLTR